jgi:importin-5
LLNALEQSTKSPEPVHRESAFRVFAALPTVVPETHIDLLKEVFFQGLQDPVALVFLS